MTDWVGGNMLREYYCHKCGLFFHAEIYTTDENGRIDRIAVTECPSCGGDMLYAVDTFGFAYFCEAHGKEVDEHKWSSLKYAPDWAIEIYKKQGFKIL